MSWKRDRENELGMHIQRLGQAVDGFLRKLDGDRSADKGEKGGRERQREDGKVPEFKELERAGERFTANILGMIPGFGQFYSSFKRIQASLTDFAAFLDGNKQKSYYPWKNADERERMSAEMMARMAKNPAPWSKEYMASLKSMTEPGQIDWQKFTMMARMAKNPAPWSKEYMASLKSMTEPGQIDWQKFTEGKKLAEALLKAEQQSRDVKANGGTPAGDGEGKLNEASNRATRARADAATRAAKVARSAKGIFSLMPDDGISKADAALLDKHIPMVSLSAKAVEGFSKAQAAGMSDVAAKGQAAAAASLPKVLPPMAELAPFSMAAAAGPAAAIAAAVVAIVALPPMLRSMAAEMAEGNRRFAGLNPQLAGSFASYDLATMQRTMAIGKRVGPTAIALNQARQAMDESWTDFDVMWQKGKNVLGIGAAKSAQIIGDMVKPFARLFGSGLETQDEASKIQDMARSAIKWMPNPLGMAVRAFDAFDWVGEKTGLWKPMGVGKTPPPSLNGGPVGDWLQAVAKAGPFVSPVHPNYNPNLKHDMNQFRRFQGITIR